jgi:glycosyltransferase involved in cell wall biosynthesis
MTGLTANESAPRSTGVPAGGPPLRVVHFTDSAGGKDRLWGKENVIVELMIAQRASGLIEPELVTFTPGLLDAKMEAAGFRVHRLEDRHRKLPTRSLGALRQALAGASPIVHAHEYKANIVARIARATGTPMHRLVATCHGWVDHTPALDLYYALDRLSAVYTDAVTVTDPAMLDLFPSLRPARLAFVQNAMPDRPIPTFEQRMQARRHFGFPAGATVVGSMGRLTKNKGILDIITAARRTADDPRIIWAIAGSGGAAGSVAAEVERCGLSNVRSVGYAESDAYLAAIDVYLQASYFEGLSLSLLEAMRSQVPSISTRAGATEFAIRDRREALLIDAGDIDAMVSAARVLHTDVDLRAELGRASRARFDDAFTIARQHAAFLDLYRS